MLKEFAQYLVGLKENQTYKIDGQIYSDNDLVRIPPVVHYPDNFFVTGLDSIVQLVKKEIGQFEKQAPIYIRVTSPSMVEVFTGYNEEMSRFCLYSAKSDVPGFREGFKDQESAIIEIKSRFQQNEDSEYLLKLLSSISKENGVKTTDNGVSQSVEARSGISLKEMVPVKPRVTLCPFRTFLEVDQPASEFVLRLNDQGQIGLFEADGGMWKMTAKKNVEGYFRSALEDYIKTGSVVVLV